MKHERRARLLTIAAIVSLGAASATCRRGQVTGPPRVSGYVEATEVRVASEVGGRALDVPVSEGDRIASGALVARIDTSDMVFARRRIEAERDQAVAQLKLLQAGARPEDIRQARAQAESAQADIAAADAAWQGATDDW
jgi:membrane fusion protein PltH